MFFYAFNAFGATIPSDIVGSWKVEEVHLNTSLGRSTEYSWNDPRLKGRIFSFSQNDVVDDVDSTIERCKNPEVHQIQTTFQDLMYRSVAGYDYPPTPGSHPSIDYKLGIDENEHIDAWSFTCANGHIWQGDLGASSASLGAAAIPGAWVVLDGGQTMYIRWRDETILLLKKIPRGEPIQASFPCANASTSTEHAICQSKQLSAFDRSISDAYRSAIKRVMKADGQVANLVGDQHRWITHRDACSADGPCILKEMRDRLEVLNNIGTR